MPELVKLHQTYKSKGLVLIGVHCDPDVAKRNASVKTNKLSYPICQDKGSKTADAYRIDGYPTVFVIDRKGIVRAVDPDDLEATVKAELAKK